MGDPMENKDFTIAKVNSLQYIKARTEINKDKIYSKKLDTLKNLEGLFIVLYDNRFNENSNDLNILGKPIATISVINEEEDGFNHWITYDFLINENYDTKQVLPILISYLQFSLVEYRIKRYKLILDLKYQDILLDNLNLRLYPIYTENEIQRVVLLDSLDVDGMFDKYSKGVNISSLKESNFNITLLNDVKSNKQ